MLSACYPSEPELLRLCRAKSWTLVKNRCNQHPEETTPTDSAVRGESSTALSVAVRSRAPLHVIQRLLSVNGSQIGVDHAVRGSVLHEALRHRANDEVLDYLVRATIHYDSRTRRSSSLLGRTDELGRTPLHYMVDRILRALDRGERNTNSWTILRNLVEGHPEAVSIIDADGTTPLVLLLLIPKFTQEMNDPDLEEEVFRMVKLMLSLCPNAAQVSRRLPRPWHYHFSYDNQNASLVHGEGVPSPLSCALLHGRSSKTVELLLDANRCIGVQACRSIVTHYREVPLHIAASMRSSPDLLQRLIREDTASLDVTDIHDLTPLDWIWVRHTLDWCSSSEPFAPIMVSRRRYIHNHFLDWYGRVSNQYLGIDKSTEESPDPAVRDWTRKLKSDLLARSSIVLPAIASRLLGSDRMIDDDDEKSLLPLAHAAALVACPLAMVKLACESHPEHLWTKDRSHGRLPLHYAASRGGYTAKYPIGVSCHVHKMEEVSPLQMILALYPTASRVTDDHQQLALHIAIDHAKAAIHHEDALMEEDSSFRSEGSAAAADDDEHPHDLRPHHQQIGALLQDYPESLQRRDGLTRLYPFQQAAEGADGNLDLAFTLLRRDPTLVQTAAL